MNPETWARISPLLDQLLDLPVSEHEAWLAAQPGLSPDDAQALRQLLRQHQDAKQQNYLSTGAGPSGADVNSIPILNSATGVGQRIGAWTIEAPLGEGGMASVWLARRSDGRHDAQAAIKLMHRRLFTSALGIDRKSTRLNSSHRNTSRMPSSA